MDEEWCLRGGRVTQIIYIHDCKLRWTISVLVGLFVADKDRYDETPPHPTLWPRSLNVLFIELHVKYVTQMLLFCFTSN